MPVGGCASFELIGTSTPEVLGSTVYLFGVFCSVLLVAVERVLPVSRLLQVSLQSPLLVPLQLQQPPLPLRRLVVFVPRHHQVDDALILRVQPNGAVINILNDDGGGDHDGDHSSAGDDDDDDITIMMMGMMIIMVTIIMIVMVMMVVGTMVVMMI